jgi:hypothetical protein
VQLPRPELEPTAVPVKNAYPTPRRSWAKVLATGGRDDATSPSHSLVAAELFDVGIGT